MSEKQTCYCTKDTLISLQIVHLLVSDGKKLYIAHNNSWKYFCVNISNKIISENTYYVRITSIKYYIDNNKYFFTRTVSDILK